MLSEVLASIKDQALDTISKAIGKNCRLDNGDMTINRLIVSILKIKFDLWI